MEAIEAGRQGGIVLSSQTRSLIVMAYRSGVRRGHAPSSMTLVMDSSSSMLSHHPRPTHGVGQKSSSPTQTQAATGDGTVMAMEEHHSGEGTSADMVEMMIRVKCETEGCSQQGFTKNVNRFVGSAGPGLGYKAPIICLGCGAEPRILNAGE